MPSPALTHLIWVQAPVLVLSADCCRPCQDRAECYKSDISGRLAPLHSTDVMKPCNWSVLMFSSLLHNQDESHSLLSIRNLFSRLDPAGKVSTEVPAYRRLWTVR